MIAKLLSFDVTVLGRTVPRSLSLLFALMLVIPIIVSGQQQTYAFNQTNLDNYVPISWYSQDGGNSLFHQHVDLNVSNATFVDVLTEIRSQSGRGEN